jgi:Cyclic nucleotide-binding domain
MSMWLHEFFFSPAALARQVGLFLLVVSLAMPTIGLVRVFVLAAAAIGFVLSAIFVQSPVDLFWWALLAVVVIVRMLIARGRGFGGHLNAEEQLFHEQVVPTLSVSQVRQLVAVGRWRDVVAGTTLTRAGQLVGELCFVTRGQVDVVVDGKRVAECGPGSLIGEIGMSTGEPATATAICATPVRYLGFEAKRLYRLLDSHVQLQDAIELAVERSLRDKLNRSNIAAAHAGDEVEG